MLLVSVVCCLLFSAGVLVCVDCSLLYVDWCCCSLLIVRWLLFVGVCCGGLRLLHDVSGLWQSLVRCLLLANC